MRLFVAIEPPASVLTELAAAIEPLQAAAPELRWTNRTAWHLTLAFLGDVDEAVLPELTARLERAARRHPPQLLAIEGAGAFPSPIRARVLWAGIRADNRRPGFAGRFRRRRRPPGRRSATRRGPQVPCAPDARALPSAGQRGRPDGGARRHRHDRVDGAVGSSDSQRARRPGAPLRRRGRVAAGRSGGRWHLSNLAGGGLQSFEHVVDAGRQRFDVGGLDRGERADAQLVATEFAIGVGVYDAVRA